jgi:hypothetical protein
VACGLQYRELEGETVMNIKALITTLVLGSSSIALADPSWSGGVSVNASVATSGVVVRDHREPAPLPPPPAPVYRTPLRRIAQPAPIAQPIVDDRCDNIHLGGDLSVYTGTTAGYVGGWLALTQPTKIERGREFISVNSNQRFSQLLLRSDGGTTQVSQVAIFFQNGQEQVVKTNAWLGSRNPDLAINLEKRGKISRIVVYGSSGQRARYSVLAA